MRAGCRWLLAAVLFGALLVPSRASAVALLPIGTFDKPTYVTSDPANPDRIFVVEQEGLIKLVQGGVTSTFADLTSVVHCCDMTSGLFSLAFPADFPQTGRLYVYYTGEDGPGNIHVAELTATGDTASIVTLRNVLTIEGVAQHYGGQLQFGPDGYLYVSTGDGNSRSGPQDLNSLKGKLLRIDPRQNGPAPYSIPQGNPFGGNVGNGAIWAYGLRNPWRFSFDRATGDLLLSDVGAETWEELNYAPLVGGLGRGANYGWNCREGRHPYAGAPATCTGFAGSTDPSFEYSHASGGCSLIGGYIARDPSLGDLYGRYVYADLCQGQIRSFSLPAASGDRAEGLRVYAPHSFGEDSCGRLYAASQGTAAPVYRFTGSAEPSCATSQQRKISARGTVETADGTIAFSVANSCSQFSSNRPTILGTLNGGRLWSKSSVTGTSCTDQLPASPLGFDTQAGTASGIFGPSAPSGLSGQPGTLQWTYHNGSPDSVEFTLLDDSNLVVLHAAEQTPGPYHGSPGGVWAFGP